MTRSRTGKLVERNDPDGGHRTFIEFISPSDVQGAMYLHLRPREGEEEEWLWSPQTRRPRRLSPGQPDEISTGLDLGYRDLAALMRVLQWNRGEASATRLRTDSLDGRACDVIEVQPAATGEASELPYASAPSSR